MKIHQFLQVFVVSLIMNVGFFPKLPVGAFVTSSTDNNSSLTTHSNPSGNSNLSLSEFLAKTSQNSQKSTIDCNLKNNANDRTGIPEPTLIRGLFFVVGLGLWSRRKKFSHHFRSIRFR